jgi:hypothetical protein
LHGGSSNHLFYLYFEQKPVKLYTPATALVGIQLGYASYHWSKGTLTITNNAKRGTFNGALVKFPKNKPETKFSGSYRCS